MLVFDPRLVALLLLSLAEDGDPDAVDALLDSEGQWLRAVEGGGGDGCAESQG